MMDDTAGLPLLGDLAAMRDAARRMGAPAACIDPAIPVDFIVDHSVIADHTGRADALGRNMALEMSRNAERYRFLRWAERPSKASCGAARARHLPPDQPRVSRARRRTDEKSGLAYPDTMVGIDSHTPMANSLGIVAWGVSGIEGLGAALGEPVALRDARGHRLPLERAPAAAVVTATDLVLTLTQRLRERNVVGKLIEYCGPGLAALSSRTVPRWRT